jgi:uncharacterized protein (DUF3820 family)
MDDNSLMPFGKYKAEKMANIPPEYLLWLYDNDKCYGDVKNYIFKNIDVLNAEINYKNKLK